MREFVLETHTFHGTHTADNISLELKRITEEWGITEKVVAVVTDNGANMVAAVHKAGWRRHPCFVHTLNLIVKDSLKAVPEVVQVLERCSAIVSYFHHSRKNTLCLNQGELSLIKQIVDALQPFEEVTREVSSEKHISVSNVIPLVSLIHRAVSACERQSNSLATQLAQQIQGVLKPFTV
uniref:Uncharacterized protein n=1 Tax=Nothobranchius rachovii TaxID=451742 RepID=A0A1A8PAP4_9TELE